jgi:TolA-binding protein
MQRKNSLTAALMAAAVLAMSFGGVNAALAQNKPQNSKAAGPVLKQAKSAADSKKWQEAIAKAKEVQGTSGKNAYDDYLANEILYFAYAKTNQYAEAAKALETSLDSEYLPKGEVPKRSRTLLTMYYQLKNYDKVIALGDKAAKEGWADDEINTWVGQAYYQKGDFKGAAKYVEASVNAQTKAGKKPKEQALLLVQSSCDKSGDTACKQRALEDLVANYPKPQYWQNLMVALNDPNTNDQTRLQVFRLSVAVDTLKRPSDFTEFAQLALDAGSPGEAQSVLEKGFEKKIFVEKRDVDRNQRLLDKAKQQATTDKAALDKMASDAAAGKSGDKDVNVGLAYLGYQQYDKAVEALNRGLGKPGLAKPAEARLLLGIAQLNAGKKDEARKSFKQVKGDPTLERLANLWSLHSQA